MYVAHRGLLAHEGRKRSWLVDEGGCPDLLNQSSWRKRKIMSVEVYG